MSEGQVCVICGKPATQAMVLVLGRWPQWVCERHAAQVKR